MANIEHQTEPAVHVESSWIEIDHASANVDERTSIDDVVYNFFDTVIDPMDERNVWVVPKPEVVVLGRIEVDDSTEVYLLEVPDGRDTRLIYEYHYDGVGLGDGYYTATIEALPQLTFRLFGKSDS